MVDCLRQELTFAPMLFRRAHTAASWPRRRSLKPVKSLSDWSHAASNVAAGGPVPANLMHFIQPDAIQSGLHQHLTPDAVSQILTSIQDVIYGELHGWVLCRRTDSHPTWSTASLTVYLCRRTCCLWCPCGCGHPKRSFCGEPLTIHCIFMVATPKLNLRRAVARLLWAMLHVGT
jgi:hypothetical protein